MILFWPDSFDEQLDRLEEKADAGDERAELVLDYTIAAMDYLRGLPEPPTEDSLRLKEVRQSGRHQVWRVAHPFHAGIAVRVICWFPPGQATAVVALFSGDKANIGDIFYDSVGSRADQIVDLWVAGQED
ncbi:MULTISPECIES: hypothetical protein [Micrococcaceae]|jgi:hypothetical protein|uniref:hypothetical protein n=1 Tax=Micrococcaceae TaxID=1268 RepID=UPI0020970824|nr:hypothetical protein [Arthrobacter sp. H16F315]MDD1478730.1 hypothetical protein [Arthrobacter sp. H16F315]MDD1478778.1 hypothetical protein [Arthrobacter sp. H16F315]